MDFNFAAYHKGEPGYEEARRKAVWNGRKPDRFPDIICLPETEQDVVTAVKYAASYNLKIGIRSGGHSWTASFLRDGGMLMDLSKLINVTIYAESGTAHVQPGIHGGDLNAILEPLGFMYPSGHCPTVAVGGFLLQGGFGWNSRQWGLSCQNVLGLDVVMADGQLIHADAHENSDLYWASRGAGPGFFGVVTRFYIKLYPRPRAIMASTYFIPITYLDELMLQLEEAQEKFPLFLEVSLVIGNGQGNVPGKTAMILAVCMGTTRDESREALQLVEDIPVASQAVAKMAFTDCTLQDLLDRVAELQNVEGRRYQVDNIWTDRLMIEILPSIHNIVDDMPPYPAHLYMLFWGPIRPLPDMAFSMQGRLWLSYYIIHTDPALDRQQSELVATKVGEMAHVGGGIQLGDENLIGRPAKFMASDNFVRLQRIRKKYDVHGRFHSYFRLPEEFEDLTATI